MNFFPDAENPIIISTSLVPNTIRNDINAFVIPEPGFVAVLTQSADNTTARFLRIRVNGVTQYFTTGQRRSGDHAIFPVLPGDEIVADSDTTNAFEAVTLIPGTANVTAVFYRIAGQSDDGVFVQSPNISQIRKQGNILQSYVDGHWLDVTPYGVMNFLDVERGNSQTLRTFDRADSAKSPHYWEQNGHTAFLDGTFGIHRVWHHHISNGEIMTIPLNIPDGTQGFRLIDFGGNLRLLEEGQDVEDGDQISANFGTVKYDRATGTASYVVRIFDFFKPIVSADIWVRYATSESIERPVAPFVPPGP